MTYNVLMGTLNPILTHSFTHCDFGSEKSGLKIARPESVWAWVSLYLASNEYVAP